ncbi:MAG TPA: response regulator [Pyrinomonadaceae bacterium]|jgi:CheY-like chemotaxis protein
MPFADGISATRALRAQPAFRDVPIVACSGDNTQYNQDSARAAGCNEFLAKPVDPEELRAILRRYLPAATTAAASN